MNILISLCGDSTLDPILRIIGYVIRVIWFGIPLVLIVLGSIDFGKAVINSKEDEVKKARKSFINRLIYAVLVFAVVWIVTLVLGFLANVGVDKTDGLDVDTTGWKTCWHKIMDLNAQDEGTATDTE